MTEVGFSLTRALQRLWTDHVIWTRQYVIAAVDDRPEVEAAATRLLKNQEDIGGAIVPFYGEAAGAKLTELLKQHIMIAVDLVAAAKSGDQENFSVHDKAWDQNAADIAAFLSGANSYWPEKVVVDLLNLHLSLTREEVIARLEKDYEKDAQIFDQILTEILTLADALAEGIMKQFPQKFAA
ncbi:MAG TPA: glycosyltransferase [Actinomycetota bacterium]|nr:glycosyltransferase [Actinomycetota bacterium]